MRIKFTPIIGLAVIGLAGCTQSDDGITPGSTGVPSALPDEAWPGGSEASWDDSGSVEEAWERGEGSEYRGAGDARGGGAGMAETADSDGGAEPGVPTSDGDEYYNGGGLEGGEVDDNDLFDEFLTYVEDALDRFGDDPMVHWLDVSRRHIIRVLDSTGNTVPDATVFIMDGEDVVATGRTHSDGRFAFFPYASGSDASSFTVIVGHGDTRGGGELNEGTDTTTLVLDGARVREGSCQLDVAFLIDATGSMGEEIDRIKETLTSIVARVSEGDDSAALRLALVEYRDFGDDFVTHTVNFTDDAVAYQTVIDGVYAGGGGDTPEALNEALHESFRSLEWRQDNALRLAFVVADAPAHYYEQATYTYDDAMLDASAMGITIYPIASGGSDGVAELQLRQLAQFTLGHFIFITEGGGSSHGSGGSEYDVDPEDFDVENLDDLVVRLITDELTACRAQVSSPM